MSDPYSGNGPSGAAGPTNPGSGAAPVPGDPAGGTYSTSPPPPPPLPRPPFPWLRLLYAIGFAVLAWVSFWLILLLLAPLHFITLAITGRPNEELKHFSLRAVHYLMELLLFVTGARDEMPFPLGTFPKT
jgi:hypothetical protein